MRAALLLAAGGSRRFGAANKLLSRRGGVPLIAPALAAARAAPAARLVVVTGAQHARVAHAVRATGSRITIVRARRHALGMAASLRAGLAALRPCERAVFVFLGDMPAIPPHLPARLARALVPGIDAVRPVHRGRPGHPVLLRRPSAAALAGLSGDRGLAVLLGRVRTIPAGPGVLRDVDTPRARWGEPDRRALR